MKRKYNGLILIFTLLISIAASAFSVSGQGSITITSPANGEVVTTDFHVFTAEVFEEVESCKKVIFKLNDTVIGETGGSGELIVEKGTLSIGNHKLEIVAIFSDNTCSYETTHFTAVKSVAEISEMEGFDNYTGVNNTNDVRFQVVDKKGTATEAIATLAVGPSNEESDKAMKLEIAGNAAVTGNAPYLEHRYLKNYGKNKLTVTYDLKLNNENDRIQLTDPFLWTGDTTFISGGVFQGTTYKVKKEWMHIEMVFDYNKRTVDLYCDKNVVFKNRAFSSNQWYKDSVFRFTLNQPSAKGPNDIKSGFTIDNFQYIKSAEYYGINSISYTKGTEEFSLSGGTLPADAETFKVYVNESLKSGTLNDKTVTFQVDDNIIPLSNIRYDEGGKCITACISGIIPKEGKGVFRILPGVSFADGQELDVPAEYRFETEKTNIKDVRFRMMQGEIKSIYQLTSDEIVSAKVDILNDTDSAQTYALVLTGRKESVLSQMAAKTVTIQPSSQIQTVYVNLADIKDPEDIYLKLIICDNLNSGIPVSKAWYLK